MGTKARSTLTSSMAPRRCQNSLQIVSLRGDKDGQLHTLVIFCGKLMVAMHIFVLYGLRVLYVYI